MHLKKFPVLSHVYGQGHASRFPREIFHNITQPLSTFCISILLIAANSPLPALHKTQLPAHLTLPITKFPTLNRYAHVVAAAELHINRQRNYA